MEKSLHLLIKNENKHKYHGQSLLQTSLFFVKRHGNVIKKWLEKHVIDLESRSLLLIRRPHYIISAINLFVEIVQQMSDSHPINK